MPANLATTEDLQALEDRLARLITQNSQPETLYLTAEQVAQRTGFSLRTVRRWISDGKPLRNGGRVYLPIKHFTATDYRVLLSDLIEFANAS